MLAELTNFIREMPGVFHLRRARMRRRFFSDSRGSWTFWGAYGSMEEARRAGGDPRRTSYDSDELVDMNLEHFREVHLFDYPVLHWLGRLIVEEEVSTLVDFGGHVGVKFYAYRDHLRLPASLRWIVVDVPAMVRQGEAMASEDGDGRLGFALELKDLPPADVLFCSGSLPYVDLSVEEIVGRMQRRPGHILVNKLAVLPDDGLVTLEGFGTHRIPYRIFALSRFDAMLTKLGYEKRDQWEIGDRELTVPFIERARAVSNLGQVWRRVD